MKKTLYFIIGLFLTINIQASELVYIKASSLNELKSLSGLEQLTINYLGNGFVIATKSGQIKQEYSLIDNDVWQPDQNYFLAFANKNKNKSYIKGIEDFGKVLHQTDDLLIFKASDQKLPLVLPPHSGSLSQIWNKEAKLPSATISFPPSKADPDPFTVARMEEVDTTIMKSNLQHLQDYGTRNAYASQSVQAQNWIKQQFESYGLSTQLFDFTMPSGPASDNVIATKTGTVYPDEYVIIGSHYDSYSNSGDAPGADDNGTGTVGIMEIARILSTYDFDRTIIFCTFSGEEYGLYGSEAYASWCESQNMDILGYLNMDMTGYLHPGDPIHTDIIAPASAQPLVDYYTSVVNLYLPTFITGPGALSGGDSDHTSFNDHGYMGIFPFEDSQNYSPYIHTSNDVIGLSVNSFEQVGIFTKAILATTVSLANMVPPETVTVTGTVTDLDTGLPIENATIQVVNTSITPITTNAAGEYTIIDILEGTYDFRISKLNYATIIQEVEVTTTNLVFDFQLQESTAWSFETGMFEPQWTFGGNAPWFITTESPYDGLYCSRSGAINDNQSTEMSIELNLTSAGTVSFFRKVSSENTYDFLRFYIDDVFQDEWSGTQAWAEANFVVSAGVHTFKWTYEKDANTVGGSDCAWVDYITFPPIAPLPDPAEIALSPMSFEVTLAPDQSATEQLNISNIGELDLDFTLLKSYISMDDKSKAYCTSVGGGGDEFIQNVSIGTINNTTAQSYYEDYTAISTQVNVGESYPITITNGDPNWSTDQCGIWVDWNQNEDFTDDGVITVSGTPGVGPYTANIVPPVDALGGPTRMRVQIIYSATPDPCVASFSYGEVEDYTLVVNSNFVDWLTLNPETGSVTGSDNMDIDLTFDATGLDLGDYFADVIINSTDPDESQLIVPCTLHVADQINIDLMAILEGPFAGSEMTASLNASNMLPLNQPFNTAPWNYTGTESVGSIPNADIVDWVLVELRHTSGSASTATPATIVATQAAFILKDGTIVDIDGTYVLRFDFVVTQNLYVVVYHRNHLGIMSVSPLVNIGGTYSFDFSSGQAHGGSSAQNEVAPGVWAMFGGDGDGNGTVNMDDKVLEWQVEAGTNGFLPEDYNLDGEVDNKDKDDCWFPNLNKGSYIPE